MSIHLILLPCDGVLGCWGWQTRWGDARGQVSLLWLEGGSFILLSARSGRSEIFAWKLDAIRASFLSPIKRLTHYDKYYFRASIYMRSSNNSLGRCILGGYCLQISTQYWVRYSRWRLLRAAGWKPLFYGFCSRSQQNSPSDAGLAVSNQKKSSKLCTSGSLGMAP